MTKKEFLRRLKNSLGNLPDEEVQKSTDFYAEMIDDRTESGMREEEATAALGSPEKVAEEILADSSFSSLVRGGTRRVGKKCRRNPFFTVVAALGFPLWGTLLLAFVCVLFAVVIVFAALWLTAAVVWLALFVASAAAALAAAVHFVLGEPLPGLLVVGAALVVLGVALLLSGPVKGLLKVVFAPVRSGARGIKKLFLRKNAA